MSQIQWQILFLLLWDMTVSGIPFFKLLQLMDKTTANVVGPRTLGVVASMLAVVRKRMQQLPTLLGPAVNCGKDTTHKTL